jgi:DNA-directed RNA polymerases I, II, and III subunit RPABC2
MEDDYADYENDDGIIGNITLDDVDLNEEEDDDEFENVNANDSEASSLEFLEETERRTKPFMTKYEYCVIRGIRLKQLSKGAVTFAKYKYTENLPINEIFDLEFDQKCIPLIIKRRLPNNKYELWKCSELDSTFLYREEKML